MSDETKDENWTTIIEPPKKGLVINFGDLWAYKYLIYLLVKKDFNTAYKQTVLGPLWFIIQPLFTTSIYTIVFSGIAKIPTDGVPAPLFYLAGNTIWTYFASVLASSTGVLAGNAGLFGKVFFPRLAVPLASSISRLYQFGIQFIFLLVVFFFYLFTGLSLKPNLWLLAIPVAMAQLFLLALGFGLWISAWSIKYRDLNQLVGFGVGLWMWASPIVYPMAFVASPFLRTVIWLNPAAQSIELFRVGFTGVGTVDPIWMLYSWGWSVAVFLIGLGLFNRAERTFIDVV